MHKTMLLCIVALAIGTTAHGQRKPRVHKSELLTEETGKKEAKSGLKQGDRLYRRGAAYYEEAAKKYGIAYAYNPTNKALNYKLGKCLLTGDDRASALAPLLASDPDIMPDYYLLLGQAYQYNRDFHRAVDAYNKYLDSSKKYTRRKAAAKVSQYINECVFSQEAMKDSASVFITNLGVGVNSYYDDYTPTLSTDGKRFFFTSRRPEREPRKVVTRYGHTEQIYEATNPADGPVTDIWRHGRLISIRNIAIAGYSKTEERLFFYKGKAENGRLRTTTLNKKGESWKGGRRVKRRVNKMAYKEGSLSLDAKNNMYFVSDRRGGEGGSDIWFAEYKRGNSWHRPVNLGATINTPHNEVSVYVSAGGDTLFFASDGHPGLGGYDIYMSVRQANGEWDEPVNMGYPINTAYDDLFYTPTGDPDVAYLASSRPGTLGGLDIFRVVADKRLPFTLAFRGVDKDNKKSIAIDYKVRDTAKGEDIKAGETGTGETLTECQFEDHGSYIIEYTADGYHSYADTVECPAEKGATTELILELEKLAHPFTLSGIITNSKTGRAVAANIEFRDTKGALIGSTTSSGMTGRYSFDFPDKVDLAIEARATDYNDARATVRATLSGDAEITQDLVMAETRVTFTLMGTVMEEDGVTPVCAQLRITPAGKTEAETVIMTDSLTGKYTASLDGGGPYWIDIEAKGYFFANDALNFGAQRFAQRNYTLKKMKAGAKITLDNILFQTGSAKLKKSSYEPLDKFADLLKKNPEVRIEVSGHTDNVGKAAVNKRLSKARAKSVRDYLAGQGVAEDRIDYEGYGMEQPVESNKTKAGREKNRRVEVKVLE